MCPEMDHRGNRKVKRLRTNKKNVEERDYSGISNILFSLRTKEGADGKSAFQAQIGKKTNTIKSVRVEKFMLEKDPLKGI